jgi:hypothetical protein
MNDSRYKAALDRFYIEPEAISDDDIALMATVDDALANKAAIRRADALRKCAEVRHRAATGQPPPKEDRADHLAEMVSCGVTVALAIPRQRIKSLEASKAELETRVRSLESRILELEARDAARTVTHADH